jgi:hypothetical protein
LEATGRSGADEGFDVRAWETLGLFDFSSEDGEDGETRRDTDDNVRERQWLIQCKREKSISPSKLEKYLAELPDPRSVEIYGIIFVAACDFSKKTRDKFYEVTRQRGFTEVKLWGKAEIEDQLFQPKNDNLLFAYFGISLQIRQRSQKAAVRARLALKRQAHKVLSPHTPVLIRDASDDRYPYPDLDTKLPLIGRRRWKVFQFEGSHYDGLRFCVFRAPAYIADDGQHWDYAEGCGRVFLHSSQDPWRTNESEREEEEARALHHAAMEKWETLGRSRAWLEEFLVLPFDNVLAIDESGDDIFNEPHIYVSRFDGRSFPFLPEKFCQLQTIDRFSQIACNGDPANRVQIFERLPDASTPER